jgi:glycosyltransferase involved in cell wall biosynthesis
MDSAVKISVIIPTHNRKERMKKCLESIFDQEFARDNYEVIVTDDGSTDGTKEMAMEFSSRENFVYLYHDNVGRAANRNIGIRGSSGDLLLFIDDDVVADRKLLTEHYKTHIENKNPKLVVLGYTPFAREINRSLMIRYYEAFWERVFARARENDQKEIYGLFITNNLSVRRDFVVGAGLFDEGFKNYSYEDTELGYRLLRNGMMLMFNENARARHYFQIDFRESLKQQYHTGSSAVVFHKKHPELKGSLSIDAATGNFDRPVGFWRRAARAIRPLFYNNLFIYMSGLFIKIFNVLLPDRASFKIISFIHWHYYLKGITKTLRLESQ